MNLNGEILSKDRVVGTVRDAVDRVIIHHDGNIDFDMASAQSVEIMML